ncbi:MAG: tRNA pseudouridine(55) synthase TruB, partial [Bdellovibrionales bacterium]
MGRRKKGLKINGWINLNKPLELGSTSAVNTVRRSLNAQKAGHAGTLDPLATGVLPIALGEATKTIPYIQDTLKTYEFTIQWGAATNTDDLEGDVIAQSDITPSQDDIEALLPNYTGDIEQTPPQFSAIKINGERAYDIARDGEDVDIPSRPVYIESLEVLSHDQSSRQTTLRMVCGKGTYVRSLARDLGEYLGCFGHICVLTRTKV